MAAIGAAFVRRSKFDQQESGSAFWAEAKFLPMPKWENRAKK
jgi:hypothetical protein